MTLYNKKYRIESARLQAWDYAGTGWYFATICTRDRACFLGEVVDGHMCLSAIGEIVAEEWQRTWDVRPRVELDEWIILPNHLHGILVLKRINPVETPRWGVSRSGISQAAPQTKAGSLGSIVGQFKSTCTKRIWAAGYHDFGWQPRFYDHIIRSERSLRMIREYVLNNPLKWDLDRYYPANSPVRPP